MVEVFDGDRGKNYPSGEDLKKKDHTLFLSAANVTNNGFSFTNNQYITEAKSNSLGNGKLTLNDIVLTSRGSIGHVAWYNSDIKQKIPFARVNSGMLILKINEHSMANYIVQYLKSPIGKKQIKLLGFGSAQPQLTKKDIKNYEIPTTIELERKRLGDFLSEFDRIITLHRRIAIILRKIMKLYLVELFTHDEKLFPKLHFSNFSTEWEQSEFNNLFEKIKSYPLSRSVETIESTGVKYIHYGDIHTKVADKVDNRSSIPNIKDNQYEALTEGDIVLADASEDYQGIAEPAVITEMTNFKIIAGLHTIALRPHTVDSMFMYYLIKSPIFRKHGYRTGTGMKVFGITATNVLKFTTLLPEFEEQYKIGNYLKEIEQIILLHKKKIDALTELKKVYLRKMFL